MAVRNTYVKVYDNIDDHPGFMAVSTEGLGLWLKALTYCHRNRTDGHFPSRAVDRWHDSDTDAPAQLTMAGRWHLPDHDCEACPQPAKGYLYLHGYLDENKSRGEIEEVSAKRAEAGSRGGRARAAKQVAKHSGGNGKQESSQSNLEVEVEVEVDKKAGHASAPSTGARKRATRLPDHFPVTDDMRAWGSENAPDVDPYREHEKFCDYWRAVGGQRGTKLDWVATWRNWMRRAQESSPGRAPQRTPDTLPPPPSGDLYGNFSGAK